MKCNCSAKFNYHKCPKCGNKLKLNGFTFCCGKCGYRKYQEEDNFTKKFLREEYCRN